MATISRQPFAPLDGARLQTLTSLKNRQNAPAGSNNDKSATGGKRKAEILDIDDFENVDPLQFAKRSKTSTPGKDLFKPSGFVLTRASLSSSVTTTPISTPLADIRALGTTKANSTPRRILQAKSPAARLITGVTKSSPITSPAGRSPTRGKRSGILNRRRSGPYSRVDPPSFNLGSSSAAPFSLDAALKGTIPGYESRAQAKSAPKENPLDLQEPDLKASWFFDIHEDTPEQEMTNMLQHSTCTLDISSDEESERKALREKDEGRDKENVPPMDDVSQTSSRRAARVAVDEMVIEKERVALGEMNTADFYADGCDESSVIIVPGDEEENELPQLTAQEPEKAPEPQAEQPSVVETCDFAPELKNVEEAAMPAPQVDILMDKPSSAAAVLQPIDGTGDSFELWESGSFKDETEAITEAMS